MIMPVFVGREPELKELQQLTIKKTASLVVIQGRRRIGKSRLIEEFAKPYRFLSFSGLPPSPKTTDQMQRDEFSRQLSEQLKLPKLSSTDWGELFSFLAQQTQEGRVIILLDEISWMGSEDPSFLGKLKNVWDQQFKKNPELILVICGSVSVWIEQNILNSTGFLGRVSLLLKLKELKINECAQLLEKLGFKGSAYEKFKLLSIMGGIPKYLEEVQPNLTAEENIRTLAFKPGGILFRDFNDIFSDIFSKRASTYKEIVETLVNGSKTYDDILSSKGITSHGHYSEYLDDLSKSNFIHKDFTWNIKDNKESNLRTYRLSDNYIRFYLKYIDKNETKIEEGLFEHQSITSLAAWNSIMGLQFENLVLNNREFIWKQLRIHTSDIVIDNPYFQRTTTRKKGCQIDYLIQTRQNVIFACEIKFSKSEITSSVIDEVKEKIKALSLPKGYSCLPVLIHVNGIQDSVEESEYFHQIIDFGLSL